jgi:hypothetical protein
VRCQQIARRLLQGTLGQHPRTDSMLRATADGSAERAIPNPIPGPLWERHSRMERQRSQRRGCGRPHRRRGLAASRRDHARARRLRAGGSFRNQGRRHRRTVTPRGHETEWR